MEGKFYIGKKVQNGILGEKLLYKASHLTTHAVVFGMTGSGKTGLCIDLLEEAALQRVPIIAIDPKGDVTNLALVFPELTPESFLPWISEEEASFKGKTKEEYARELADKWRKGLQTWDISPERLKEFREKVQVRIFTPGSTAGLLVNIVSGFEKPPYDFHQDPELYLEKIKNSVSALLNLLGEEADPLKNPAHIFLSTIIEHFWSKGRELSLENLILAIQQPPIKKMGVFDIDTIFPPQQRLSLALKMNNLVASPNFRLWRQGQPLDPSSLYVGEGKTPINIFYIAHLSEKERMFFVSLLFNEVLSFVRTLPGSSQLKYLLYMDEIFGYLPPYPYNPPSKNPLLLLLKQARAFGLGLVLVTQNPKDIDYKGLTNIGTWFIGKLQAEGDRERVLEGLQGAITSQGIEINRSELAKILQGLSSRNFILHDAREGGPTLFKTRWAMSYLAGPLTRRQIKSLNKGKKIRRPSEERQTPREKYLSYPPSPPAGLETLFEDTDTSNPVYSPYLLASVELLFDEPKFGFYYRERLRIVTDLQGENIEEFEGELRSSPVEGARFLPFPSPLTVKALNSLRKKLKERLLATRKTTLYRNPSLKLVSQVGEDREAFKLRCREAAQGRMRRELEKIKEKYARKLQALEGKLRTAQARLEGMEARYKGRMAEEALSIGEILLGLALGRKPTTVLTRTARRRRMTAEAKHKIESIQERIEDLKERISLLQQEMEREEELIREKYARILEDIREHTVNLERNDILISDLTLAWLEEPGGETTEVP